MPDGGGATGSAPGGLRRGTLSWRAALVLVWVADVAIHARPLGRVVLPALDEGVYLYAARLMADGLVPYRDFFLSHPPFLMAAAAAGLSACRFDVPLFSFLYVCWVFSAVFPLALVVRRLGGSRTAAILAGVLLSLSAVFAGNDGHFFALRQASAPLLLWGLAALLRGRHATGGALLGAFAVGVVTNVVLAGSVLVAWVLLGTDPGRGRPKAVARATMPFLVVTAASLAIVLSIPRGAENVFGVQVDRPRATLAERAGQLRRGGVAADVPLLAVGLLGAALAGGRARLPGLAHALAMPVILLGPNTFYPHYLALFVPGLAASAALVVDRLRGASVGRSRLAGAGLLAVSFLVPGRQVLATAFRGETEEVLKTIEVLSRCPEPLLAYEPIYALHARRLLTYHYHVADVRFLRADRRNLDSAVFDCLVAGSGTVLVEPYFASLLTPERRRALEESFVPVRTGAQHVVLVRRPAAGPPAVPAPPR